MRLWSLLECLIPDTLIKGDFLYVNSIIKPLRTYKVWNEELKLKDRFKDFTFVLNTIRESGSLFNLSKTYFGKDRAKALGFLNNVYYYASTYCD